MEKVINTGNSIVFQNAYFDFNSGEVLSPIQTENYFIMQVADSYYLNEFNISTHKQHFDLEITFAVTNGLFCKTDDKTEKLEKGNCYLSFKGENHSLFSKNGARFQTLAFNVKDASTHKNLLCEIRKLFLDKKIFNSKELSYNFSEIISEFYDQKLPFKEVFLDSQITSVLVNIARKNYKRQVKNLSFQDVLPDIAGFIDKNYLSICSLDELAYHFGYSYSHISKIFKKNYKVSPKEYLAEKRMNHAKKMIEDGSKLYEIAEALGYSNVYNFSRAYKNIFGKPPKGAKKRT